MKSMRTVIHVDMNAYFASVEALAQPDLRGRAFAVAPPGRRSIILTASYEARRRGVKTAMPVHEALERCPELIRVAPDFAKYADLCGRLFHLYREFTPQVEVASIDEVFMDVSAVVSRWAGPAELARAIQARVRNDFHLPCSLGVAPNKLLAKLASDLQKPEGLVVISGDNPSLFVLEHLPVNEICGIGPRTAAELLSLGIRTLGELGRAPRDVLWGRWGSHGERLRLLALGIDESEVVPPEAAPEARSVGHAMTLERNLTDRREMAHHLLDLSSRVAARLRKGGWRARTLRLVLRTSDFKTFGRQRSFSDGVDTALEIHRVVVGILEKTPIPRPIRLLGVTASGLVPESGQESVFPDLRASHRLAHAVDRVNERWGDSAVAPAALLGPRRRPLSNPIPWRGASSEALGLEVDI